MLIDAVLLILFANLSALPALAGANSCRTFGNHSPAASNKRTEEKARPTGQV